MAGNKIQIPFPLSTAPGDFASEDRGRMVNCYVENLDNTKGNLWRRSPGCFAFGAEQASSWTYWALEVEWSNPPEAPALPTGAFRGGIFVNNTLYEVIGSNVYTITSSGSATKIGTVSGDDK